MRTLHKILAFLILIQFSCSRQVLYVPDFSEQIDYSTREIKYSGNDMIPENAINYKFFNQSGQLIEQIGHEYRIKYFYDSISDLIEKFNCRMYNCEIGWRDLMIYDNNKNLIGIYWTLETAVDLDTAKFEQSKFYNESGKLLRELIDRGSNMQGDKYEIWRDYSYNDQLISKEIDTENGDTTWIGNYNYDDIGRLINITRILGKLKEQTNFIYNERGQLIKESIESNEYPLTEDLSFSVKNNTTTYDYDSQGRLIKEVTLNHKGKVYRTFLYSFD
jgi:YD repeat-containing protein